MEIPKITVTAVQCFHATAPSITKGVGKRDWSPPPLPIPPKIWSSCYYTQLPQKDIQNLEIKMNSALITCNKLNPRLTLPQLPKSCLRPSDNRSVLTSNNTMKIGCSERPGSNLGTCVYSIETSGIHMTQSVTCTVKPPTNPYLPMCVNHVACSWHPSTLLHVQTLSPMLVVR